MLLGQVMERMRLTPFGSLVGSKQKMPQTFVIIAIGYFIYSGYIQVIDTIIQESNVGFTKFMRWGAFVVFFVWFTLALMKTRRTIRETYSIPGSSGEDCLASFFCSCCVGESRLKLLVVLAVLSIIYHYPMFY